MIKIYNTLTRRKEIFQRRNIVLYTCGVTVYDYSHIGHARVSIFFDTLIRYLNYMHYNIKFIRNITDIDDKIILKSCKKKLSIKSLSNFFISKMHIDNRSLRIFEPTFEPKATNFIKNILNLIKFLQNKKYAYKNFGEDIYYKISENGNYGELSGNIVLNGKLTTKNIKVFNKNFDFDFTLWKSDKKFWESPWGYGRPGWHSECAAMNLYYADPFIDIHSGGKDLLFPHHENELAQIVPFKGNDFIKLWMHVGCVKIDGKKMSKSLGNNVSLKNILKKFNEEYLRFFFLLTHYRKSLNYSLFDFTKSNISLRNLYKLIIKLRVKSKLDKYFYNRFFKFLNDDFNTVGAISVLFELASKIKFEKNFLSLKSQCLIYTLKYLGSKLGLFKYVPLKFLYGCIDLRKDVIYKLLDKRSIARSNKDWVQADRIRSRLLKFGIKIVDTKNGSFFIFK